MAKTLWKVRAPTGASVEVVDNAGTAELLVDGVKVIGEQQAFIADPAGGSTTDTEARAAIASIIDVLIAHGLIAAS